MDGGSADRYDAVLFDLLTAVLDSGSLWNSVAAQDSGVEGERWRAEYLRLTYGTGRYRPYEDLVAEAAARTGLDASCAERLLARWDELAPWPEAPAVLARLARGGPIGTVTNCSEALGRRAASRVGVAFDVVVTAEAAGAYKPRPEPYREALAALDLPAERVLFVAGSHYDIAGAAAVGMTVWWHNRVHLTRDRPPAPTAEHDTLASLPDFYFA